MNGKKSIIPTALGLVLFASVAADGHEIMRSADDNEWSLYARFELELLGGLWVTFGLAPRWARVSALTVFLGILVFDFVRAVRGDPARPIFGGIVTEPFWVLGSELMIILSLVRWQPAAGQEAWIDSHPRRAVGAALIAAASGVAIDWSQIGRFPIVTRTRNYISPGVKDLDYLVYLPRGYYRSAWSAGLLAPREWPLILALHGAGATGHDIDRIKTEGLPRRIEEKGGIPFVVVAPQSPRGGWDVLALDGLLSEVVTRYRVDPDRIYLTGESMGGYGVWNMAATYPERFAAIAPICGGGRADWADRLRAIPTWAFHGADDDVIPVKESRKMVTAIGRTGGDARLTVYPRVGHDAWTATFADPEFYNWLLSHRRGSR